MCVAGSEPMAKGIVLPAHMHSQITVEWHIVPEHLLHAQVEPQERLTSPCIITVGYNAVFSATFILYRPIRSHRVF